MIDYWLGRLPAEREERIRYWGRRILILLIMGMFVVLGTLALAFQPLLEAADTLNLKAGEVAARDIVAPRGLTYPSEVDTERARQDAIARVQPVFEANPDVNREQIRVTRLITTYINEIRHDRYARREQQIEDLLLIEVLTVSEVIWNRILDLPDTRWDLMSNEISALVERTMQRDIRADNLGIVRSTLVNSVASRFSNAEAEVIVAISEDLIQPNTVFNEQQTQLRRDEAAASIQPQERVFEKGQLIVRSGTIITESEVEALGEFGLLQSEGFQGQVLFGSALLLLIGYVSIGLYMERFYPALMRNRRMLLLLSTVFLVFLWGVNVFGQEGANQPYLYPSAALGLVIVSLAAPQLAITITILLALLTGFTQADDFAIQFTIYVLMGGIFGVLSMRRTERLNNYFISGGVIGLVNMVVIVAFAFLSDQTPALAQVAVDSMLGIGNGLFSAGIALVILYIVTSTLNLTTTLKLLELQDFKNPLLQKLLREAPGTYQHSLQVGNLSVLAAEAIGADAQLCRVAAMYHDIGKTLNPYYFVENTAGGINPHDDLNDPYQSAKVIIGHVIEGDKIAKRAKLPQRIRDFILEHHGTTLVVYFYNQALERAPDDDSVDPSLFMYPGPVPLSKETGIMMLADGCESATRAQQPSQKADIEAIVNSIFEDRLARGQLDNSNLTLNDIKIIRLTFIETLQAMYHPRIAYKPRPPLKKATQPSPQITSGVTLEEEAPSLPAPPPETIEPAKVEPIAAALDQDQGQEVEQPAPKKHDTREIDTRAVTDLQGLLSDDYLLSEKPSDDSLAQVRYPDSDDLPTQKPQPEPEPEEAEVSEKRAPQDDE